MTRKSYLCSLLHRRVLRLFAVLEKLFDSQQVARIFARGFRLGISSYKKVPFRGCVVASLLPAPSGQPYLQEIGGAYLVFLCGTRHIDERLHSAPPSVHAYTACRCSIF